MSPSEVLWLSGLFTGLVFSLPLSLVIDRLLLRPVARLVHALAGYDRGA